jgi:hypothetical protein
MLSHQREAIAGIELDQGVGGYRWHGGSTVC